MATPPVLPAPTVTTVEAVKAHYRITDAADDAALAPIVAAVDALVRRLRVAAEADGLEAWPGTIGLGATMLAGRLLRRRDSPEGVAVFTADGAAYVQRNDPDVAMLLRLGSYGKPALG